MKIEIAAIGKLKQKPCRALMAQYSGRIEHYIGFEHSALRESKLTRQNVAAGLSEEVAQFEKRCTPSTVRVAMDERGELPSSREFAAMIERWMVHGERHVAFFIGSANGLDASFKERCDHTLALSPMTLPHELARVLLAEQIYRALTIIRGEPYHK